MGRRGALGVTNGNYRGGDYYFYRLAVKASQRGQLTRVEFERIMNNKKMRAMYWEQRLVNAMDALYTADPNGCEAWYDNDQHVPADATTKQMALLVESRVKDLTGAAPFYRARARRGIFIWQDRIGFFVYSKEVGIRKLYLNDFPTFEAAEAFVSGLTAEHLGYGVVLDLIPVVFPSSVEE